MTFSPSRWRLACAALVSVTALSASAMAQGYPPPQGYPPQQGYPPGQPGGPPPANPTPANPMCQRLEGQLAMITRGGVDPAKAEQIRRYEDAQNKQQAELDRVSMQAKRMGCDSSGLFSLFNGQAAQCGPINNQIQQMRANLDQIINSLQQLRGGGGAEREAQRRSVLTALAQNNCGPQYAAAARAAQPQPGNFFESIFGGGNNAPPPDAMPPDAGPATPSGTYRTVCVRSCDGFYFPISFATVPSRFADDERTCKNLCPAADATLFTYRNPGEDINQAVSINGQSYSSSPNAFRYRQEFNPSCSCKAAGQTWSDALKNIDEKGAAEQGDIIVTEDRAKKMSQPLAPTKTVQKKGAAPAAPATPQAAAPTDQPPAADSGASGDNKTIRSVGPTFIPAR